MTRQRFDSTLRNMTVVEFCDYLDQMAVDFDASGANATAADYREASRRLDSLCERFFDLADVVLAMRKQL